MSKINAPSSPRWSPLPHWHEEAKPERLCPRSSSFVSVRRAESPPGPPGVACAHACDTGKAQRSSGQRIGSVLGVPFGPDLWSLRHVIAQQYSGGSHCWDG